MLMGTACAIGAGIVMPAFSIIFGDIIDAFHGPDPVEQVRGVLYDVLLHARTVYTAVSSTGNRLFFFLLWVGWDLLVVVVMVVVLVVVVMVISGGGGSGVVWAYCW